MGFFFPILLFLHVFSWQMGVKWGSWLQTIVTAARGHKPVVLLNCSPLHGCLKDRIALFKLLQMQWQHFKKLIALLMPFKIWSVKDFYMLDRLWPSVVDAIQTVNWPIVRESKNMFSCRNEAWYYQSIINFSCWQLMRQLQYCTIRQLYKHAMHLWTAAYVCTCVCVCVGESRFKQVWTEATWCQVKLR